MRLLILSCCFLIVGGRASAIASLPQTPAPISIPDLLDRYTAGEHEAAVAAERDLTKLRRELAAVAPDWIRAEGPRSEDRRRLAAAAIALEVAWQRREDWRKNPVIDETEKGMSRPITDLLEWGCVLLDRNPRGPGEHAWHVAAVVLLQGVGDFSFLLGPSDDKYRDPSGGRRLRSLAHLDHATLRFPDDDWFRLPKIIPLLWLAASGPQHTTTLDEKAARAAIRREVRAEPPWYRTKIVEIETIPWARHYVRLWEFVAALEPLLKYEKILGEIHLHLGYAYLRLARPDLALERLRQVPARTEDRSLLYMSWYLSGRAYQAAGDRTRAIAAYRTAIGMMRGQSAAFALAALLFNTGGRDEAIDLVQETLAVRPPVADPWRVYGMGDFRLWAPNIERVRAEVRQR